MYTQINNLKIAYTDVGEGLPIVFVHGYPLDRQLWRPQVAGLSNTARVLAPDLRGHGESQAVQGPYSMELFAEDLDNLLNVLRITRPIVLCGLSMGGYAALAFYRNYADRLAGLILTATRAVADTPDGKRGRDQAIYLAHKKGVAPIIDAIFPKLMAPDTYTDKPKVVEQARAMMERTSLEGILGDLAGMKSRPDSTDLLPTINIPTLVIHGDQDAIIPLSEARAMSDAIPGADLEIIPGAGHLPNLENPDAFNQAVMKFLHKL